ncbi:MAG: Extracellular ribonuclease precursor [Tenericutes bacterium ADurb.Bin087]|nr:MAG: Extracellular ribonuclease precursor [Tenericutes bacterium ADurb.Bin087]
MSNQKCKLSIALLLGLITLPSLRYIQKQQVNKISAAPTILTTRSSQSYIDSYYSSISPTATGNTLKSSLESLLKAERNRSFSYGSHQTAAFPYTDVDPARPHDGYIVSFYSGTPVKGYSGMNKEHTWPKSHGGNRIESDPHVIRPTLTSENSARGNMYYAQSPNPGWDPAEFDNPKYRGISARIIFYGATIGASSGLILEDVGRGQASGTGNKMGKLGDLLKWNFQYPVDQTEIIRNETLDLSLDYNRNPFIDDPSLACRIWGDTNSNTQSICAQYSVAPDTMSLSPSSATVNVGTTQTLTLSVSPTSASKDVIWTSSHPSVATVNNGLVSPLTVGVTTITATSTLDSSVKASSTITVTNDPIPVTGVSLERSSASLTLGKSLTLSASVLPSSASDKRLNWTSGNNAIATVSSAGLVTGHSLGTTTISVTTLDGGFSDTLTLTVTEQPAVTSIRGTFYNTNTANSGGENGVTTANLNQGITDVGAIGFGGATVVSSLKDVTQAYYPRSGGLALGSSKNPGSMTLVLNENYHAYKVEVVFNDAGTGNNTIGLSGNKPQKSAKNGSIGTEHSNPSTGSAYVVEFDSPASEVTISTDKRTALVEVIIHYGEEATPITPSQEATNWAVDFLSLTSEGCSNANFTQLESIWAQASTSYTALNDEAKTIITRATPNGHGNEIEEALARYVIIIEQYELHAFISGLQLADPARQPLLNDPASSAFILLAGLALAGVVATFFYTIKKRRTNEL